MAHALKSTLVPGVQMRHHQCPNVKFDLSPHGHLRGFIGHADAGRIDRRDRSINSSWKSATGCFVVLSMLKRTSA